MKIGVFSDLESEFWRWNFTPFALRCAFDEEAAAFLSFLSFLRFFGSERKGETTMRMETMTEEDESELD